MVQHQGRLSPLVLPRLQNHLLAYIVRKDLIGALLIIWHVILTVAASFCVVTQFRVLSNKCFLIIH